MCAETCAWGLEATARPQTRGPGLQSHQAQPKARGEAPCPGPGSVRAGMLWRGANRCLRRSERTTATSPRRSTAFRAQGRHETKQVMQPAQRGTMRPVETRIMAPVAARPEAGCSDPVHPQTTHKCANRRLRRRARRGLRGCAQQQFLGVCCAVGCAVSWVDVGVVGAGPVVSFDCAGGGW